MDAHQSSRVNPSGPHRSHATAAPAVVARRGATYPRPVESRRSPLREERHPSAVTAPPLHRGSMPPVPWRGFWNSIGTAVLMRLTGRTKSHAAAVPAAGLPQDQAWQGAAQRRRWTFALLTVLTTAFASTLFAGVQPDYDNAWLGYGQIALFALLSAWVVTGFLTGLMGFWVMVRGDKYALSVRSVAGYTLAPDARTAIIMPICNEDVNTVFAGLRATCESVAATGHGATFDVFVLSGCVSGPGGLRSASAGPCGRRPRCRGRRCRRSGLPCPC